jgi:hypothetical protein
VFGGATAWTKPYQVLNQFSCPLGLSVASFPAASKADQCAGGLL